MMFCCSVLSTAVLLASLQPTQVSLHGRLKRQSSVEETPVVFPTMEEMPENRCIAYDGGVGSCRRAELCVYRFETTRHLEDSACTMDNGEVGICCPGKPPPTRATGPNRPESPVSMPDITSTDLDFAGQEGRSIVQRIDHLEVELQRRGINEPRASYDRGPLPSAREVSVRISIGEDRPSKKVTVTFSLWAQFLAYDLSLTGVTHAGNGDGILCCHSEIQKNSRLLHPACMPIHVPDNDPYFEQFGTSCMHFLRSVAAPRSDCTFGPREQLNQVTAYIDGSSIYGASDSKTKVLRSFEGGKLKWSVIGGEEMLPRNRSLPCSSKDTPCFATGDQRSNQNVLLSLIHGLMVRQHNRLADGLSLMNKGWSDEILFREARRLLSAQIQHITFSEFLPLLVGNRVMSSYGLSPKLSGYSFDYDRELNAAIINSFATAANRFGHTLVQGEVEMYSSQGGRKQKDLRPNFDPSLLYAKGSFEALIRGLTRQPSQEFDTHVSRQLTDKLFGDSGRGLDLVALNIQRGRDHGLPGYNEWREYCGLPRLRNFEDLATVVDPLTARNFSRLYGNVDDVDLYPAGIAENPLPDAILGPTFACIVAEQFRRLKLGDRFWYENGGMESSFNEDQLQEIRKVTLSRILCDNTNVESVQLVAFVKPVKWNPTEDCRAGKIPGMTLSPWRNEPVWT